MDLLWQHRQYGLEVIVKRLEKQQGQNLTKKELQRESRPLRYAVAFFIIQDIAGVIYTIFGKGEPVTLPLIAVAASVSGFAFVPFLQVI